MKQKKNLKKEKINSSSVNNNNISRIYEVNWQNK